MTIKEIAKALGVSKSTVSRAFTGGDISPITKQKVLDYVERFNYKPNPLALSLVKRRAKAIGVVVPEISNSFFSEAINGIENFAYKAGYTVIITQTKESVEKETQQVNFLASGSVDGLILSLATSSTDSYLMTLQEKGLPIVLFDRTTKTPNIPQLKVDNYGGAFEATDFLVKKGCKKILHITRGMSLLTSQERLLGYKSALQTRLIQYDEKLVLVVDDLTVLVPSLIQYFSRPGEQVPDAIFIAQDKLTILTLKALITMNRPCISKVQVIGFTNLEETGLFKVQLSTIKQPAFEMGEEAARTLIELIESRIRPEAEIITFKVNLSES